MIVRYPLMFFSLKLSKLTMGHAEMCVKAVVGGGAGVCVLLMHSAVLGLH